MVINQFNGKIKKFIGFSIVIGSLFANKPNNLNAGEMPTNPAVQSGQATITGTGTNHLQVNTKTNKTLTINLDEYDDTKEVVDKNDISEIPKEVLEKVFKKKKK